MIIKNQRIYALIICLSCSFFYFFQIIQATMFNSLNASLMQEFSISAKEVAVLSSGYFYSNIVFLFIAGIIVEYMYRKKILLIACGGNILSLLGFSLAQAPWQIFVCHFITGLAGSFSLITAIRLISNWSSKEQLATTTGFIVMIGALGGIVAQTPFVILINAFGWRSTLQLTAIFGFFSFIMILFFVKESPDSHQLNLPQFDLIIFKKNLKSVVTNHVNWILGFWGAIMNMPVFILAALWGNLFLVQTYGLNPITAGTISSMIGIGGTAGSFLLAYLSDYLQKRKIIVTFSAAASFILTILVFFTRFSFAAPIIMGVLFLLLGFTAGVQPVLFTLTKELNDDKLFSSAQGMMMSLMMSGGLLQNVFSWILELKWSHLVQNGVPVFSANDYKRAGLILLAGYSISFILSLYIKEPNKKAAKFLR